MQHHPTSFFVAHALYTGRSFRNGAEWGALTDGPESRTKVADRIADHFMSEPPTLENLRVWQFSDDAPVRDVTEDLIIEWEIANAPTEEEMAEQRACDDADDYVSLLREYA